MRRTGEPTEVTVVGIGVDYEEMPSGLEYTLDLPHAREAIAGPKEVSETGACYVHQSFAQRQRIGRCAQSRNVGCSMPLDSGPHPAQHPRIGFHYQYVSRLCGIP